MGNAVSALIKTNGAMLAVRQYAGSGRPIVLLHGGPGLGDYLGPVAELLSPPHWVISYDQRGCGASSRAGPFHFNDHVEDLNDLRRQLGVEQLHLFGHSWGGLLAQLYAKAYPQHVASLVLCCSIANTGTALEALEQKLLAERVIRRAQTPAGLFWFWLSQAPGLADVGYQQLIRLIYRFYYARPEQAPPFVGAERINKRSGDLTMVSVHATDASYLQTVPLAAPILILQGRADVFREVHAVLRERFPQAESVWVEDAGHFVWVEQTEAVRETLVRFYREAEGRAAAASDKEMAG